MSDAPLIAVRSLANTTPEEARDARARAWTFILDSYDKKKATLPGGPDDANKKSSEGEGFEK
jgi:hypothetical protein